MEVIAQLVDERGYVMIIPDGVHVPSDFIRLTHKVVEAVKPGRVIWVSDASPLSGAPQGDYTFCGEPARVDFDEDKRLRTFPLTGSYEQLAQCLTILRGMKIVSEADIRAGVTTNPLALVEPALKRINRFPDLGTVG
jgi:N-acetylglucosamine-6-phosphate deacetylase